jgi:colicin import membrane protein
MVVGVDWLEKPKPIKSTVEVVQAKMIDQARIDAEVAKLKEAEKKKESEADAKRRKEEKRLADLKKKQEKEKKRLADLEKKRKTEEKKRKTDAKKKAEAEKKRKAAAKKKAEAEKKRKAEAKKKAAAEKKRKAELEKKRKAEAERKRKAKAEKKRKAEEAARRAAEQKAREDALAAQLEGERLASERDRYLVLIRDKIERNWLRPTTVNECLKALMRVRLIPGGAVAAVNITRGSGNGAFDRSAEQAIYKADPLPVPTGAGFEAFRDFNIEFKPDCN